LHRALLREAALRGALVALAAVLPLAVDEVDFELL